MTYATRSTCRSRVRCCAALFGMLVLMTLPSCEFLWDEFFTLDGVPSLEEQLRQDLDH